MYSTCTRSMLGSIIKCRWMLCLCGVTRRVGSQLRQNTANLDLTCEFLRSLYVFFPHVEKSLYILFQST